MMLKQSGLKICEKTTNFPLEVKDYIAMNTGINIQAIDTKIQVIKKATEELKPLADKFPAVARNAARLMASVKMLEIEVSDIANLTK